MSPEFEEAAVLDILLNRDNPRHEPKDTQEDVIAFLLADEEVYNLARHMSKNGINPLEVVAVFPDEDGNLVAAEGNRRICAAQLLTDPYKAPEKVRKRFKTLSEKSVDVSHVNVAIFPDYEAAEPWLQILHDGEQDGVGRKRWKPEQKARASKGKSNDALAVAVLDYAEELGIVDKADRKRIRVSTATRYLANPVVRKAMGIMSSTTNDSVQINTELERFTSVLTDFVEGIAEGRLHSRSVTKDWVAYAGELEQRFGEVPADAPAVDVRAKNRAAKASAKAGKPVTRARLATPQTRFIARSKPLVDALNDLSSFKLSSLYKSLVRIALDDHPALMTTASWVFLETLTALHGRSEGVAFVSYLTPKMGAWGFGRDRVRDCRASLEYIQLQGNAVKHSSIFAPVDARNLSVHFQLLDDVFVNLAREAAASKAGTP